MVNPQLTFITYRSFYERSRIIRAIYQELSNDEKYVYKYYVYSRRLLHEKTCDAIWEYINAEDDFNILVARAKLVDELSKYE